MIQGAAVGGATRVPCRRCQSPVEAEDLRCALCGLATEIGHAQASARSLVSISRCTRCGAAVTYQAEARAPHCGFCGSTMKLEEPADPIEQAEYALPFRISAQQAQEALRAWMKTLSWFRPSNLSSEARMQSLLPLWWAAWIFDADAMVSWTADSNAGSGRSAWAPHAGQARIDFDQILVPATRGLKSHECAALAPHFDLRTATHVQSIPENETAQFERFDLQRSAARKEIVRAIERTAAQRVQQQHVPGTSFRKVKCAVLLQRLLTRRVALPTYVLAYQYDGKLYRAVVHGQDASCVRGDAPLSWARVMAAAAIVLLLVVTAVAIASLASR